MSVHAWSEHLREPRSLGRDISTMIGLGRQSDLACGTSVPIRPALPIVPRRRSDHRERKPTPA
jgi:hypothetical protein